MVAYAIARQFHRRLFRSLFYYFIAALFIPFPVLMLPAAKQAAILVLDNQAGLVLLYTVYGLSFNVFLYTAYVRSIPAELEEAARMDGRRPGACSGGWSSRCSPRSTPPSASSRACGHGTTSCSRSSSSPTRTPRPSSWPSTSSRASSPPTTPSP